MSKDDQIEMEGTVAETLPNSRIVIGLSWRNLGHALGAPAESRDWGVLYLGSSHVHDMAKVGGPLVAVDHKGAPFANQAAARAGLAGLADRLRPLSPLPIVDCVAALAEAGVAAVTADRAAGLSARPSPKAIEFGRSGWLG